MMHGPINISVHANLFCESLQILLLLGHVCTTQGCQKSHIMKRTFVCLYVIMQVINVTVRHYAPTRMVHIGYSAKNQVIFPILLLLCWSDSVEQCRQYNLVSRAAEMLPYNTELWVFIVKAIYECESVVQRDY